MTILKVKAWTRRHEIRIMLAQTIKLDKYNIIKWKELFNLVIQPFYKLDNYTDCISDADWFENYTGMTPYDAVQEEMNNWED